VRRAVGGVAHPHPVQRLVDPRERLGRRQAQVQRTERDVLAHRGHEELVVRVLEHQPDAPAQLAHVVATDAQPRDVELAATGQQPVEVEHERGFARAVGPEQRDPLVLRDLEVDAAQRPVPVGVRERQPARGDHAIATRSGINARSTRATNARSADASRSGVSSGIRPL
jgi:hypothetical protein